MKKKAIAIALVLVVALGSAFAAKSSLFASKSVPDTKIGVQMGYGARSITANVPSVNTTWNYMNSGFYAAGTFEFGVANNIALKVEGGINTMGKQKTTMKVGSLSADTDSASDKTPVNFTVFAGVVYDLPLNDKLSLDLGAGMDVMIGKFNSADSAKTNAAFGLGLEAGVSIDVAKNISIVGGGKFGWHFLYSDDDLQGISSGDNHSTSNITYKFFGGLAYSL